MLSETLVAKHIRKGGLTNLRSIRHWLECILGVVDSFLVV
jgi:hypothetical protein